MLSTKLWKSANITPIHKDGDHEPVENYRRILLLSIIGKCQERIVYDAIYNQVISFAHDSHHRFLTGRSCTTLEHQQCVVVKGEASNWLTVTSSVPQGCLLGPLFFTIIYTSMIYQE